MVSYKRLCFIAFFAFSSICIFAQNNIINDINAGVSYLGKPLPSNFIEFEESDMFLDEIKMKYPNGYLDGKDIALYLSIIDERLWFLVVHDGIVIISQICYLYIIDDIRMIIDNYKLFFENNEWISADKKQANDTVAFVDKSGIHILCETLSADSEPESLIITFTNEEMIIKL
jgi:hypothetical protein